MTQAARAAVLISGSGTNLQAILKVIDSGELPLKIACVISDRGDALGLERARAARAPTTVVDYAAIGDRAIAESALQQELKRVGPDLVVLAGFMRILPAALVEAYSGRMLNIHPSLLPKYRGLNTYTRALAAGDEEHGSTVHFVVPELDAGPAIIQYRVPISADETEKSLKAKVQAGEYLIYPEAIGWLATRRLVFEHNAAWLDGRQLDGPIIRRPA